METSKTNIASEVMPSKAEHSIPVSVKFIYWFAYYNLDSPSVRYRAKYPLDYAASALGISHYLVVPGYTPIRLVKFIRAYLSALLFRKKDSLIVIQRVQSSFIYAALLKFLVKIRDSNTVYDLDDADYLEYKPDTIHYFARNCQFISAGSKEIARYISPFNEKVTHLTSPTPDLGIVKKKKNPVFTIGWVGGYGGGHKIGLLSLVFPAIKALPFSCKLILIGVRNPDDMHEIEDYFVDCKHVGVEMPHLKDWNNELDLQKQIALFDVGIATLINTPLHLSKSGIKAKQYMNNGVPVLSTDLPENNVVVKDGINGFFCNSSHDFKRRFQEFQAMSDDEYGGFSSNARASIVFFNHKKYFDDLNRMINTSF